MAEEATVVAQPIVDEKQDRIIIPSSLLANVWEENPTTSAQPKPEEKQEVKAENLDAPKIDEAAKPESKVEPTPAPTTAPVAESKTDPDAVDADQYLKDQLGYESWEAAKAAKAELEELKKQPKVEKFNLEDKADDIYAYLNTKKQLERVEKLDVSDVKNAEEVLKTNLQFKYKDLTRDEVDRKFNKLFPIPAKPKQTELISDEDHAAAVRDWEANIQDLQKDIVIEAKLAKPELAEYKTKLKAPEIPMQTAQAPQPTQEELAVMENNAKEYLSSLESNIKSFTGFSTNVKDEAVDLQIGYSVTDEERTALKKDLENFDPLPWLQSRWLTKDGRIDIVKLANDKYVLENQTKIFQKVANEAASKRLEAYMKAKSNINVTGGETPVLKSPEDKSIREKEIQNIWENG